MVKSRSRVLTIYVAILVFCFSLPCLTSAYVFDIRQNFPAHIQGTNGIYLQYRNGTNYVDLINNNPFGGGGLSNDYVFTNPDLTDPDHFPAILAYEYNNPVPSQNQISAAPSCIPRSNINADAVIRINLADNGGQVQIKGSCGRSSSDDVYFTIYKGAGNYSSPVWSTWNSGIIDVTIPYSQGEQLFFATNSGTSCTDGNLAYWKDLNLLITPLAAFSGIPTTGPVPLSVTFTDQSTGNPTGWAWYFGDESYTDPWTLVNGSAGWEARVHHSSVVMPDGSIVLMGGDVNGGKNDTWRSTDNGATWTVVNASSGWSERYGHSSVVMPDGSIVLMGGCYGDSNCRNDTWRSTDSGATWMLMNVSSGWSGRCIHSSVAMPDGSIVLMGGFTDDPFLNNDVWRSMDYGATWTLVNASPGWSERRGHSSVVMPDGSIVLMGGEGPSIKNDTWKSIDNGTTWTQMTANAEWSGRDYHSSVVMSDGSILLMGGWSFDDLSLKNDMWRSTDIGHMWMQVNASAGWSGRKGHSSVVMSDGSIVLIGGQDSIFSANYKNDVWRFQPTGSSAQNPSHTYIKPGIYNVALLVYNDSGYKSTLKTGYITAIVAPVAIFTAIPTFGTAPLTVQFNDTSTNIPAAWNWSFRNVTGNNTQVVFSTLQNPSHTFGAGNYSIVLNASNSAGYDLSNQVTFINVTAAIANVTSKIGIFRPSSGIWSLDSNSNYVWEVSDKSLSWGLPNDTPVIGDWNGDGKDGIGIFRSSSGIWSLDSNENFVWEPSDVSLSWGLPNDTPVIGDWNGDNKDDIGIFRPSSGIWSLDSNGNFAWEVSDKSLSWGLPNDAPVIGDWNGDGKDGIGIFRPTSGIWSLDSNENFIWDVSDMGLFWGLPNDKPVLGDWNGNGPTKIGIFRPSSGIWSLDSNGNYIWEVSDKSLSWGVPNDQPVIGDWNGDGKDGIGIFRPSSGIWSLDSNGNYIWEVSDMSLFWGLPNDKPVVGKY